MSRFRVRWRGAIWDADLICDPGTAKAAVWQIYGHPCAPSSGGALQNHWVPVAEAPEVRGNQITVSNPSVNEPPPGQQATMVYTVGLNPASANTLTLSYATRNASATAGFDYLATSGLLVFAPGETSKQVTVTVLGDSVSPEPIEQVALDVSEPFTFDPPVTGYGSISNWTINRPGTSY